MSLKREFTFICSKIVKDSVLKKPLFYNSNFSIRFDLQTESNSIEDYFDENYYRSLLLFNDCIDENDEIIICIQQYVYKKKTKIHKQNFLLKQIKLERSKYIFYKVRNLYDKSDCYNRLLIKTKYKNTHIENIIKGIAHIDYPNRSPQLVKSISQLGIEIYFLNVKNEILINMYDDRGLDIAASNIEVLRDIYNRRNDWILEYDKKEIIVKFNK